MNAEQVENEADGAATQVAIDGKLTVCLTDRIPVRIVDAKWPVVARTMMPIYRLMPDVVNCSLHEAIKATLEEPYYPIIGDMNDGEPVAKEPEETRNEHVSILWWLEVVIRKNQDGRFLLYGNRKNGEEKSATLADSLGGAVIPASGDLRNAITTNIRAFVDMCGGCCDFAFQKYVEKCLLAFPPEILDDVNCKKEDSGFVVLNGPRKVQISQGEWPVLAEAKTPILYYRHDFHDYDEGLTTYGHERLVVRRHHDGKCLVYGYLRYEDPWAAQFDLFNARGGELLSNGANLPHAIKQVGESLGLSETSIRSCLNGLPAEDLD